MPVARKMLGFGTYQLAKPRLPTRNMSTTRPVFSLQQTTVHKGVAFEKRSLKLLEQTMSMSLKSVGGKEDGGIDLIGWWWLPHDATSAPGVAAASSSRRRIRIIGQCKAEKKKLGPNYVRELEGVLYRFLTMSSSIPSVFPSVDQPDMPPDALEDPQLPMVALLISESQFTKSTILRAHSSPIPFFLLHLPQLTEGSIDEDSLDPQTNFGYAICNPALSGARGLLKGQMEIRWERHHLGQHGRPAVWWNNERLQNKNFEVNTLASDEALLAPLDDVEAAKS